MRSAYMPFCCSIRLLGEFGGTCNADHADGGHDAKQIERWVSDQMEFEAKLGMGAIAISTNNEQKVANKVLRAMGFSHTPWMVANIHNTKVRIWWMALQDD